MSPADDRTPAPEWAPATPDRALAAPAAGPLSGPQPRRRILLVDDEADLLLVYGKRLEALGYEVQTVGDGLAAVRRALEWRPHCVVLDIMMPEPNGWDTCRILQLLPSTRNIPVLMCSTKNEREDVVHSLSVGARDYIIKPMDMKIVGPKLARAMGLTDTADTALATDPATGAGAGDGAADDGDAAEVEGLIQRLEVARSAPPGTARPSGAGAPGEMGLETELRGDTLLMELKGPLKNAGAFRLEDAMREAMALQVRKFILDLTGVTNAVWEFNDVLDQVYRNAVRDGARVRVVAKNAYIRQVLTQRQFRGRTHGDVHEALRGFQ